MFMQAGLPRKLRSGWKSIWISGPKIYDLPALQTLTPLISPCGAKVPAHACEQQHPSLEKLKSLESQAWAALDPDYIMHTCQQFQLHLRW
jgi:hypothetical protein